MSSQPYDPSQQQQQIYPYNYNHQQFQPLSDPYQPQQYYHNQTQSSSSSSYPPPYHTPAGSNTNYGVEDSSIHPPGVPLHESNVSIASSDAQNQHNSYYYYYPNAPIAEMPQNNQTHVQITQNTAPHECFMKDMFHYINPAWTLFCLASICHENMEARLYAADEIIDVEV